MRPAPRPWAAPCGPCPALPPSGGAFRVSSDAFAGINPTRAESAARERARGQGDIAGPWEGVRAFQSRPAVSKWLSPGPRVCGRDPGNVRTGRPACLTVFDAYLAGCGSGSRRRRYEWVAASARNSLTRAASCASRRWCPGSMARKIVSSPASVPAIPSTSVRSSITASGCA